MTGRRSGLAVRRLAIGTLALSAAIAAVVTPARAITLGEIAVNSAIGQPLSAQIPIELGAGEMLTAGCVSAPAGDSSTLNRVPSPVVGVPETRTSGAQSLRITTSQPLYEPMYELRLQVRCPGTALLVRQYVLMLDLPAVTATAPSADPSRARTPTGADVSPGASAERPARPRPSKATRAVSADPIAGGTRYRVQAGDTLSTIAARVSDRGGLNLWQFADRIFAANPGAFVGSNRDLIKLGWEITIPTATQGAPDAAVAPAAETTATAPAAAMASTPVAPEAITAQPAPADTTAISPSADVPAAIAPAENAPEAEAPAENAPAVTAAAENAIAAEAPATPGVAGRDATNDESTSTGWLAALMGLLLGAVASSVLLRDRLIAAFRRWRATEDAGPGTGASLERPVKKPPLPIRTGPAREPSMIVTEGSRSEDSDTQIMPRHARAPAAGKIAAAAAPAVENTAEDVLAEVFNSSVDDAATDPGITGSELDLDLDLPQAAAEAVQSGIGDDTNIAEAAIARALGIGRRSADRAGGASGDAAPLTDQPEGILGRTDEQLDLHTMVQMAPGDSHLAETLHEALELLESDYEEEMSRSQRLTRAALDADPTAADDKEDDQLPLTGTDQGARSHR